MGKSEENSLKSGLFPLSLDYAKALSYTWIMANVISMAKKVAVITALVEGCSVRSTSRMTGVSKGAILRLLVSVGTACTEFHNSVVRNVEAKRLQVDETWSFVGCKQKNVTDKKIERDGICGD